MNISKKIAIVFLGFASSSVFALSESECAYLKPVETPEMKIFCSQPGHNCVINTLPYLQCLQQTTVVPTPPRSCGIGTLNPSCKFYGGVGVRP